MNHKSIVEVGESGYDRIPIVPCMTRWSTGGPAALRCSSQRVPLADLRDSAERAGVAVLPLIPRGS
eukprot:2219540-Amphidinium_carterae.1